MECATLLLAATKAVLTPNTNCAGDTMEETGLKI